MNQPSKHGPIRLSPSLRDFNPPHDGSGCAHPHAPRAPRPRTPPPPRHAERDPGPPYHGGGHRPSPRRRMPPPPPPHRRDPYPSHSPRQSLSPRHPRQQPGPPYNASGLPSSPRQWNPPPPRYCGPPYQGGGHPLSPRRRMPPPPQPPRIDPDQPHPSRQRLSPRHPRQQPGPPYNASGLPSSPRQWNSPPPRYCGPPYQGGGHPLSPRRRMPPPPQPPRIDLDQPHPSRQRLPPTARHPRQYPGPPPPYNFSGFPLSPHPRTSPPALHPRREPGPPCQDGGHRRKDTPLTRYTSVGYDRLPRHSIDLEQAVPLPQEAPPSPPIDTAPTYRPHRETRLPPRHPPAYAAGDVRGLAPYPRRSNEIRKWRRLGHLTPQQRRNRRRKERNRLRSATNEQLDWFRDKVRAISEIYPVEGLMSKVPLMDYKNAMFQHSTDGFIYWKEEVDHSRLHNLLISMGNSSPEAIREINNKLGLLYTADALAQLESQDKEAAGNMRALLQKQAEALELLLEHPRTKDMLTPLTHQELRRMNRM